MLIVCDSNKQTVETCDYAYLGKPCDKLKNMIPVVTNILNIEYIKFLILH